MIAWLSVGYYDEWRPGGRKLVGRWLVREMLLWELHPASVGIPTGDSRPLWAPIQVTAIQTSLTRTSHDADIVGLSAGNLPLLG